jgi:hypothetical protein
MCALVWTTLIAASSAWGQYAPLPSPSDYLPPSFSDQFVPPRPFAGVVDDSVVPLAGPITEVERSERFLQIMPNGLIYRSYMAGVKEPRFASVWSSENDFGPVWDIAIGGRVGILRYGTTDDNRPEGWQLDFEGAVFPRLDPNGVSTPLIAADYRAGIPLTYGRGPLHCKFAYYHLSSHLGDEFLLSTGHPRINYTRDALVLGAGYYCTDALRVYGEVGYAFNAVDGAKPWEVQFGADLSPPHTGLKGSPFAAVNAHLREEVNFGGNFVAQAGWQWRQYANGRIFRLGVQYFNGMSDRYEFFDDYENKVGGGLWFDY